MSVLVFAIGPVQGFISQSRRTADGWVGSYLLSYLAGHALAYLEDQLTKDNIIEPDLNVPMYRAIQALHLRGGGCLTPRSIDGDTTIAALPNVLVVNIPNGEKPGELGRESEGAVQKAWETLHQAVWSQLPDAMRTKAQVQAIWNCQVRHHWECYWAWGKDSTEAFRNLAARKGLRDFEPTEERGDRCTVCAQREALWDESSKNSRHHQARDTARENWGVWVQLLNGIDLGLGKSKKTPHNLFQKVGKERLCAICLIKRLIPWTPNPIFHTWKTGTTSPDEPSVFPSTSTMATALYRTELIRRACDHPVLREKLNGYFEDLKRPNKGYGSRADPLEAFLCWEPTKQIAVEHGWDADRVERLLRMDGDWYLYGEAVKNEEDIQDGVHRVLQDAYRQLRQAARNAGVKEAPIYYAVLTMDGDKMGDFKEEMVKAWGWPAAKEKLREISAVLNRFAQDVPRIVRRHEGRTIYAGGDDVVALFPLEIALEAAETIRNRFFELFEEWIPCQDGTICKIPSKLLPRTLSGSIVYAHHQAPLGGVLREGHKLLTEWAKKRAGRNALALQHYQRGGAGTTFAARWEDDHGTSLVARLQKLVERLSDRQVASRFLYGMQELAWMFGSKGPFGDPTNPDGVTYVKSLLLKSRLSEGKSEAEREKEAEQLAKELLALCRTAVGEAKDALATEPLLLARFLAGGGREER